MQHAFLDRLAAVLLPEGFRPTDSEVFRRPWPGGFDAVVPMTVDHPSTIKLDFSLSIRHDAVEELLAEADPQSNAQGKNGATSITRMGELTAGLSPDAPLPDFHYVTESPEELAAALQDFSARMKQDGATHFRDLRDPGAMERAFNGHPDMPCIHCRNEVRRVLRGLTLAALYRPAALTGLIETYHRHYVAAWDTKRLVPRFDAVVSHLRGLDR